MLQLTIIGGDQFRDVARNTCISPRENENKKISRRVR
jgi:hypothetical protein